MGGEGDVGDVFLACTRDARLAGKTEGGTLAEAYRCATKSA